MSRERELGERIRRHIPLADTMQITVERLAPTEVVLSAPLAPNVNDKGCAFGGSIVSLLTLAGWALLREAVAGGEDAEIYVVDSRIEYLRPVYETLRAHARFPAELDWAAARRRFREQGRVKLSVLAELRLADGAAACRLEGRFAAFGAERDRGPR